MWNNGTTVNTISFVYEQAANLTESYFMSVTPLAWIVMKSSSIMEVIIAPFSKRLQLFKSADKGRR